MSRPILVVSAFGRGQSLAAHLEELEIPVRFIDVSEDLGTTAPEDEEGPFGFFTTGLSALNLERLLQDDPPLNVETGLNIVIGTGPIELRSPLTKNRLEKLGMTSDQYDSLREYSQNLSFKPSREQKKISTIRDIKKKSFWINKLAADWITQQSSYLPVVSKYGFDLPIFSDFFMRPTTRIGSAKSLAWLERKKVFVEKNLKVLDLAHNEKKQWKGLQVRKRDSQTTEFLQFEQLIWCLTSEETQFLNHNLLEKIFPGGLLESQWHWTRFRLRFTSSVAVTSLPLHSLWIADIDLPWTHENFFVLQRCLSPDLFDVWIRIPTSQRLQKSYLIEKLDKIKHYLMNRLPRTEVVSAEMPLAAEKSYTEIGPVRFPIYDEGELKTFNKKLLSRKEKNLHCYSSEVWNGLGWNASANKEKEIISYFKQWWVQREELRIKKELKNSMQSKKHERNIQP